MKEKLYQLHKASKKIGCTIRMPVHDEFCGDVPDEESAKMISELLNKQSFDTKVPILWDLKTGESWGGCDRGND
jgi:DNA polymerase I-like protein with 3'-5' exonuclease and polymerase domains